MRKGRKCGSAWGCYYFISENKIVKRFVQCQVFVQLPPGRHPNDKYPVKNLRGAPDLCNNISSAVLFGSNGNSYLETFMNKMFTI